MRRSARVRERYDNEAKHHRANANIRQHWLPNRVRLANTRDRAKQGCVGMQRSSDGYSGLWTSVLKGALQ